MGGGDGGFHTTRWSIIDQIGSKAGGVNSELVGDMLKSYWKPVYCCLRRKGYDNEQSKDLTQGFFHEVVLGRRLIQRADHNKGRFRTLLLTALDRYLTSEHRKKTAQKRIPDNKLVRIDWMVGGRIPEQVCGATGEESFNYAWLSELLDQILKEVEEKCRADGIEVYWDVFRDRVLSPIIEGTAPPAMGQICEEYGIETSAKASNMILTVKRRFESAVKRRLRQSVASDDEVDIELQALMRLCETKNAR
jgi:RNA polymerase sigma-70 factor (ECF subfamily)